MAYSDIAHIMWEIFADARIFFSTPINKAGEFQRSTLSILRGNLTTGTIERQDVAPIKVQEPIHNFHSRGRCRNQTPIPWYHGAAPYGVIPFLGAVAEQLGLLVTASEKEQAERMPTSAAYVPPLPQETKTFSIVCTDRSETRAVTAQPGNDLDNWRLTLRRWYGQECTKVVRTE
jgi:hypothetical protein